MSVVVVRAREPSTFQEFLELLVEYERSLPVELRHGPEPDLAFVRHAYDGANAAFAAYVENIAAGCVALTRHDASTAIVQRLYVRPEYRKHGLGRALVAVVVEFCRDYNYERVVLDTERERMLTAYHLYASLGFTACDPYGPVMYANPTFMQLHLKSRQL